MIIGFSAPGAGGCIAVDDAGSAGMRAAAETMIAQMQPAYGRKDVEDMQDFLTRMQQLAAGEAG